MKLSVVNVTGNGVMVVAIEGRVDSSNAQRFERVLDAVADAGKRGIVLDLENLTYIQQCGAARAAGTHQGPGAERRHAHGLHRAGVPAQGSRGERLRSDHSRA